MTKPAMSPRTAVHICTTTYLPHRQIRVILCGTLVQRWDSLSNHVTCLIRQVSDVVPKCTLLKEGSGTYTPLDAVNFERRKICAKLTKKMKKIIYEVILKFCSEENCKNYYTVIHQLMLQQKCNYCFDHFFTTR